MHCGVLGVGRMRTWPGEGRQTLGGPQASEISAGAILPHTKAMTASAGPGLIRPVRRSRRAPGPTELGLVAAVAGLMFIAEPALNSFNSDLGDAVSAGATLFSAPIILTRLRSAPRVLLMVLVFCALYAFSAVATSNHDQGLRHTIAAVTASTALLVFVTFGKDMVQYTWFRHSTYLLILAGIAGVAVGGLPKNITGGATLYLVALFISVLLVRSPRRAGRFVLGFFLIITSLAFLLDFRGLVGYSLVLVLAYWGAAKLPKRVYWLSGIAGAGAVIGATIWYFLNVYSSEIATLITRVVVDASGRPATSGRDWLWPAIIHAVERNQLFGLGAGTLPRDILPTTLSSHSYYLQVYLQLGMAGVAVLIMLLLAIWQPLAASERATGRFGAAVFLMFVTHNATEVLMFQNGLIAGIPGWCAIGLAVATASEMAAGVNNRRPVDGLIPPRRIEAET